MAPSSARSRRSSTPRHFPSCRTAHNRWAGTHQRGMSRSNRPASCCSPGTGLATRSCGAFPRVVGRHPRGTGDPPSLRVPRTPTRSRSAAWFRPMHKTPWRRAMRRGRPDAAHVSQPTTAAPRDVANRLPRTVSTIRHRPRRASVEPRLAVDPRRRRTTRSAPRRSCIRSPP